MPIELKKIDDFILTINSTLKDSVHTEAYFYIKEAYKYLKEEEENKDKIESAINKAKEKWEEYNNSHPTDYVSLHHLAVIFHSLAWDKENEGKGQEAIGYWGKALKYWAKLLDFPDFWNNQAKKMIDFATENKGFDFYKDRFNVMKGNLSPELQNEAKARKKWDDALKYWFDHKKIIDWWIDFENIGIQLGGVNLKEFSEIRNILPQNLLNIHYSLILYYNAMNKLDLAHEHMNLIIQSDFLNNYIECIREELAKTLLPPRDSVSLGKEFKKGITDAEKLLTIDPNNVWGLEFIIFSYNENNFAYSDQDDLKALERNMQKIAKAAYISSLEELIKDSKNYPHSILKSAESEIEKINMPIVSLCTKRTNDYVNKVNITNNIFSLSSREREDLKNCCKKILKYKAKIELEEKDNLRYILSDLSS